MSDENNDVPQVVPTPTAGDEPTGASQVGANQEAEEPVVPKSREQFAEMSGGKKAIGCGCLVAIVGAILLILIAIVSAIAWIGGDKSSTTSTSSTVSTTAPTVVPTVAPTTLPVTTQAPTTVAPTIGVPATAAPTTTAPVQTTTSPSSSDVYYANCSVAKAAGAAPIHQGQPGYSSKLDRDGDGVACES